MENEGTIVLLHGYGANKHDLEFIIDEWSPFFPNWNFISLNGLMKLPQGGYAWFDLTDENWMEGIEKAADYISSQFENHKKPLVFAGFSQGAFLSTYLAAYSKMNIKAAVSFSGGLIPFNKPLKPTPLCLIHGSEDDIILPSWFEESLNFAKEKEIPTQGVLIPGMGHDINQEALAYSSAKLREMISSNKKNIMQ